MHAFPIEQLKSSIFIQYWMILVITFWMTVSCNYIHPILDDTYLAIRNFSMMRTRIIQYYLHEIIIQKVTTRIIQYWMLYHGKPYFQRNFLVNIQLKSCAIYIIILPSRLVASACCCLVTMMPVHKRILHTCAPQSEP